MNNFTNTLLLIVICFIALYFNVWYLILFAGVLFGILSKNSTLITGLIALSSVTVLWTGLLFLKDGSFATAPSILLGKAFGDISSILIPFIGGFIGGIIAFLGALGGRNLKHV